MAVLVPIAGDEDLDSLVPAHSPAFQRLLQNAGQRIRETAGITHEELCRRLGLAP